MGREELKWRQLAHHQLMSQPKTSFYQKSGKMASSGIILDVAFASVYSEQIRLKKIMIMIIIMNKSQEMTAVSGRQNLTSAMKLRPGRLQI